MFNAISYWINSTSEVVNKQLPPIQKNELLAEILTNPFEKGKISQLERLNYIQLPSQPTHNL